MILAWVTCSTKVEAFVGTVLVTANATSLPVVNDAVVVWNLYNPDHDQIAYTNEFGMVTFGKLTDRCSTIAVCGAPFGAGAVETSLASDFRAQLRHCARSESTGLSTCDGAQSSITPYQPDLWDMCYAPGNPKRIWVGVVHFQVLLDGREPLKHVDGLYISIVGPTRITDAGTDFRGALNATLQRGSYVWSVWCTDTRWRMPEPPFDSFDLYGSPCPPTEIVLHLSSR